MIGLSFVYELFLVDIHWPAAIEGAFVPTVPQGSLLIIMSVLGAVVMPHNLSFTLRLYRVVRSIWRVTNASVTC